MCTNSLTIVVGTGVPTVRVHNPGAERRGRRLLQCLYHTSFLLHISPAILKKLEISIKISMYFQTLLKKILLNSKICGIIIMRN